MRTRRQFRSCLVTTRMKKEDERGVVGLEKKNLNESDSSRRSGGQPGIQRCRATSFACVTPASCEAAAAAAPAAAEAPSTS